MVKKKKSEDSGLTKNQVIILVAIIGVIGAFVGGPTYNTMHQERAIIEFSFGNTKDYPKPELEFDGTNYFIDITAINLGKSQTNPTLIITAKNAVVSFDKTFWSERLSQSLIVRPSEEPEFYRFYIQPDENFNNFSLQFVPSFMFIHEVYDVKPIYVEFEKSNGVYNLIKAF